jgi:hypothetical protein
MFVWSAGIWMQPPVPVRQPCRCRGEARRRLGDEGKAVGSVPPTALLFVALRAKPRRIGGVDQLSPTKGEHLRAA